MSSEPLPRRMTALDASFFYTEQPTAPMHIGGVDVLVGDTTANDIASLLGSKIHLLPRYSQRAVATPFNLGHPTWENDPGFDVSDHVEEVQVPAPGTDVQLRNTAARLFARMLDRDRPLWKIYVLRGLEDGHSALLSLVHHCMVDGVSGVELMNAILDTSPDPRPVEPQPRNEEPAAEPEARLRDALWDTLTGQLESISEFQRDTVHLLRTLRAGDGMPVARELPAVLGDLLKPVPPLPFNERKFSGKRKLDWCVCSMAEAREIRKRLGGTVNDVVLATLAGAVQHYLEHHNATKRRKRLRVMVPVSVRAEQERGDLGNQVSMLPVDIPLGKMDPAERLEAVVERTAALKRMRTAEWLKTLMHLWEGSHPAVQALLGQAVFAPGIQSTVGAAILSPGMHMVATNVPGPQIPLFAAGRRVLAHYPLLPVVPGMGLNVGIFSYAHRLHFGFIADAAATPDITRFRQCFEKSFVELRTAAGVGEIEPIDIPVRRKRNAQPKRKTKAVAAKKKSTNKRKAPAKQPVAAKAKSKPKTKTARKKPVAAKSKRTRTKKES